MTSKKVFSESGNNTELTETYRGCLDKGELLVCEINHNQVSTERKFGLTKVRPDLFLMLLNPIAPKLTVAYGKPILSHFESGRFRQVILYIGTHARDSRLCFIYVFFYK